jgi:SET domain-containing protein
MILIKTKIGQSAKHGIGLFADQFIPKGTPTWKYHPKFDMALSQEDLDEMSETSREQMIWYCYFDFDINKYILCFDDQRFINHSKTNFNIESTPTQDIAARDIQPGEELLCDYNLFDKEYWQRHKIDQSTLRD